MSVKDTQLPWTPITIMDLYELKPPTHPSNHLLDPLNTREENVVIPSDFMHTHNHIQAHAHRFFTLILTLNLLKDTPFNLKLVLNSQKTKCILFSRARKDDF